jgi:hypothetical protein
MATIKKAVKKAIAKKVMDKVAPMMKGGGTLSPSKNAVSKNISNLNKAKDGASFPDLNKDGKITADDRKVLGSAVPTYSLGFNNDFKIYNFDFSVNIFARVGQMFVSDYANKFEPNAIENGAVVNFWTPTNPTNDYPRPNSSISKAALPFATTLGYADGSYLKIRNITLGYTFPQKVAQKLHLGSLRWYVSAKNYFIFSNVKNYDPEGAGSFERPLTKLIVTGINIDL